MSSGPPSRRNAARDLARAAQRAAREAEHEAQREAEVAAFDKAFSDAAARAPHDHAEASAARDDQAAVKTAQAREDYKSQAREDYSVQPRKGDVLTSTTSSGPRLISVLPPRIAGDASVCFLRRADLPQRKQGGGNR